MGRLMTERVAVSLTLLLAAAGLMASTFGLSFAELGGAFSPTFFPQIILIAWIALAALTVIADLMATDRPPAAKALAVLAVAGALLAEALLMTTLGFFICSALVSALILTVTGQRSAWQVIAYSVLVPAFLAMLFSHALKMPLPSSPFVWWI